MCTCTDISRFDRGLLTLPIDGSGAAHFVIGFFPGTTTPVVFQPRLCGVSIDSGNACWCNDRCGTRRAAGYPLCPAPCDRTCQVRLDGNKSFEGTTRMDLERMGIPDSDSCMKVDLSYDSLPSHQVGMIFPRSHHAVNLGGWKSKTVPMLPVVEEQTLEACTRLLLTDSSPGLEYDLPAWCDFSGSYMGQVDMKHSPSNF